MSDLAEIMQTNLKAIGPDQTIINAARQMRDEHIGSLIVEDRGNYVGILTETDVVRKGAAQGRDLSKLLVGELMTQPLMGIESTKSIRDANDRMGEAGVRHLAVLEAGRVVGMVSVRDILMHFKTASDPIYAEPKISQD